MKTIEKLPYLISIVSCFYGATTGRTGLVSADSMFLAGVIIWVCFNIVSAIRGLD